MATNNAINRIGPWPMFRVYLGTSILNATGAETNINPLIFDLVDFNTYTGSYSTVTGIYTVPVSGKYVFSSSIFFRNIDGSIVGTSVGIVMPGKFNNFYGLENPGAMAASGDLAIGGSTMNDLVVGDTVNVFAAMNGGADTVTIFGGAVADPRTWFYGYMVG
jgi:hypothetical protein